MRQKNVLGDERQDKRTGLPARLGTLLLIGRVPDRSLSHVALHKRYVLNVAGQVAKKLRVGRFEIVISSEWTIGLQTYCPSM